GSRGASWSKCPTPATWSCSTNRSSFTIRSTGSARRSWRRVCEGVRPMGALEGIRVVELATVFAGPATAMHLADQGAEVIKVESPLGDDARRIGAMFDGETPSYLALNRNKRGIVLDLSKPEARPIMMDLLRSADVFITNFRS